jgi:hypothetical protein
MAIGTLQILGDFYLVLSFTNTMTNLTNLVAARLILAAPGGASPESPLSGPTIRHRTYGPEY